MAQMETTGRGYLNVPLFQGNYNTIPNQCPLYGLLVKVARGVFQFGVLKQP